MMIISNFILHIISTNFTCLMPKLAPRNKEDMSKSIPAIKYIYFGMKIKLWVQIGVYVRWVHKELISKSPGETDV